MEPRKKLSEADIRDINLRLELLRLNQEMTEEDCSTIEWVIDSWLDMDHD